MTRQSFQTGYVSQPISTRQGIVFKIRYRVRTEEGRWKHKSETLHGVSGRKAARVILAERIRTTSSATTAGGNLTVNGLVENYWRPYLARKKAKPSTLATYNSAMNLHILPLLGEVRITEVLPSDIENLLQAKLKSGLSEKTVRNLVALLQGVFSVAEDNDLIPRSPVRKKTQTNRSTPRKACLEPYSTPPNH